MAKVQSVTRIVKDIVKETTQGLEEKLREKEPWQQVRHAIFQMHFNMGGEGFITDYF